MWCGCFYNLDFVAVLYVSFVALMTDTWCKLITCFNSQVSLHEAIMVEADLASPPPQQYLSKFFQSLLHPPQWIRLESSLSAPHAGAWISAIPSTTGLALHLEPAKCQVALRWWLGLDTSEGSLCSLCPDILLDPLGHHTASYRRGGDVVTNCVTSLQIFVIYLWAPQPITVRSVARAIMGRELVHG
jgi:hypothetical protein